jgi:hypothetical protein
MYWIYGINFLIILVIALLLFRIFKPKANITIPPLILSDGLKVPLLGSYLSTRWLQRISKMANLVHNELYPSLKLYADRFEYTVLYKKSRQYNEIEKLDASSRKLMRYLVFYFKNENQIVSLNLNSVHNLKEVLLFFQSKGIPLSPDAAELVK